MPCWQFKVLYDGECPFCRREVQWLKRRDRAGRLAAEDISALGFEPAKYGLSRDEVVRVLHGVRSDGTVVKGMDAVRDAYGAAGLGWLVAPTRLPLVRTISDCGYRLFARFRIPISRLLGGGCAGGSCALRSRADHSSERTCPDKQPI